MSSPTKTAEDAFQFAMNTLQQVKTNTTDEVNLNVRSALSNMAYGEAPLCRPARHLHSSGGRAEELRQYNQTRRP